MNVDSQALKEWLRHWQFWCLEIQFVLLAALTWINLPALWRAIRPAPQAITAMTAVTAFAAVLIFGVAPETNRIFYDEHIYQSVAQNMADLHLAQSCNDGQVETGRLVCVRGEYNKEPQGYPYLLSIPFRVFGASEAMAHRMNGICALVLLWIVFALTMLLFRDPRAAVAAPLLLAMVPQQSLWAHTAAAEPSAALMAAFAVLAVVYHTQTRTWTSRFWMIAAIVFAVQFRMEVVFVVPIALAAAIVLAPRELARPATIVAAGVGLLLGAAHLVHLLAVSGDSWGSEGERIALEHARHNITVNGHFYLGDERFPVVITLLAIAGLVVRPARALMVPVVAFLCFWGIFLFFYAGSYDFGADVRFSVMSNAWIAVVAGRGAAELTRVADRLRANTRHALLACVMLLIVQFLWYLPQIRSIGEEAWAARADVSFARAMIPRLPRNAMVFAHNPSIFHLNGMNAAQMSIATSQPDYVRNHLTERYAGGIYLHWNAWCGYHDASQRALCASTLKAFDSELVGEYVERDFRYAFYKVKTRDTIIKTSP